MCFQGGGGRGDVISLIPNPNPNSTCKGGGECVFRVGGGGDVLSPDSNSRYWGAER